MSIHRVPASAGLDWITQAIGLIKRWPLVFPVIGLIIAVLGMIPWLGGLIALILGPALIGGSAAAAHTADRGGAPSVEQVFQAFQQGDRTGSMIALCIPTIVAILIAGVLIFIFAVGAILSGGLSNPEAMLADPRAIFATFGAGLLLLVPLIILLLFAIYAFTFFAIPRTMLGTIEAFPAMRESFAACRANLGAFVLTCVVLVVGSWIVLLVLHGLHLGRVGDLLTSAALYSVLGSTLYFGAKAVLGGEDNDSTQIPAPVPANESAPPPPPPAAAD